MQPKKLGIFRLQLRWPLSRSVCKSHQSYLCAFSQALHATFLSVLSDFRVLIMSFYNVLDMTKGYIFFVRFIELLRNILLEYLSARFIAKLDE